MASSFQEQFDVTCASIKKMYTETIEPIEKRYQYELFKPSFFADTLKPSKPFVLFLGPFSAGKSTFINYLLGHDYLWTGPQPTTDKFTVIMHGAELNTVSGRILTSNADLPFRGLAEFGNQFLETFSGMQVPADLLRNVTLIDTPGVLESAQDVHSRQYDYIKVARWFVEMSDLVFVMFDPSKLDAGVELRSLFNQLKGHESKLRMVLNKADLCEPQELMRVYGSLFWSLSNLISTTEPPRVYVSSFWNKPYRTPANKELFDEEKADLMYDLLEVVPLQCLDKRVTAVMRRALDVQIHAHIVGTMKEKMPGLIGKSSAKQKMLANMDPIYDEVATKYKLTRADFPPPHMYATFFDRPQVHMSEFPKLADLEKEAKKGAENPLKALERIIRFDLPKLLHPLAQAAAVDPRKARKEKQGQGNAPPDKSVFIQNITDRQIEKTRMYPPAAAVPEPTPPPAAQPTAPGARENPPPGQPGHMPAHLLPQAAAPEPQPTYNHPYPPQGYPPQGYPPPTQGYPGYPPPGQPQGYPPPPGAYQPPPGYPPHQYQQAPPGYPPQGYPQQPPPQGYPPQGGQPPTQGYYPPPAQQGYQPPPQPQYQPPPQQHSQGYGPPSPQGPPPPAAYPQQPSQAVFFVPRNVFNFLKHRIFRMFCLD